MCLKEKILRSRFLPFSNDLRYARATIVALFSQGLSFTGPRNPLERKHAGHVQAQKLFLLVYRKITIIVYTRGMAKLSRKSLWLLLKKMVVCSCGTRPYF